AHGRGREGDPRRTQHDQQDREQVDQQGRRTRRLPRAHQGREGRGRLQEHGQLRCPDPGREVALGHLPLHGGGGGAGDDRPRGDRFQDRRRAALLSAEPRPHRGRSIRHDRVGLHRAHRQRAPHGVRGGDEPADPAADGGLGRMTYTEQTQTASPVVRSGAPAENLDAFRAAADDLSRRHNEPEWARALRRDALDASAGQPFPNASMELWRRTDSGPLPLGTLAPFAPGAPARNVDDLPPLVLQRLHGEGSHAGIVAQRNSDVSLEQTHPALASRGVILCSMDRAIREHGDLVQAHVQRLIDLRHDKLTALAALLRSGGAFLYVPDGRDVEIPVRFFQWVDAPGAVHAPHNLIVVGANARVTVVEELLGETQSQPAFHCGATEAFVGSDSKLVFATLQDWGRHMFHYSNQRARLDRGAELQWVQTVLGGRRVKTNSYFHLEGAGAQAFVHGFAFGDTTQHFDQHTLQKHVTDHT